MIDSLMLLLREDVTVVFLVLSALNTEIFIGKLPLSLRLALEQGPTSTGHRVRTYDQQSEFVLPVLTTGLLSQRETAKFLFGYNVLALRQFGDKNPGGCDWRSRLNCGDLWMALSLGPGFVLRKSSTQRKFVGHFVILPSQDHRPSPARRKGEPLFGKCPK